MGLALWSLPAPLTAAAADDQGKVVYEAQCAPCHGMAGEGGYGARLATPHLAHARNKADIIKVVRQGLPGTTMPSFGLLPDVEIAQVSGYVQLLGRVSEVPLPGDPVKGKALYEANRCSGCHILRGDGSGFGPELTEVGERRNFDYLRKKLADPSAQITEGFMTVRAVTKDGTAIEGIRISEDNFWVLIRDPARRLHSFRKSDLETYDRLEQRSMMPSYADSFSDSEMNDLVSFLATRRAQ
jgi:putative heme-binding domain-containing protein